MDLLAQLRIQAKERQAQDALCYADGGKETNALPSDYLEWKAADEIERLREALRDIYNCHIGDQPAALNIDDNAWARRCHMHLRLMARDALNDNTMNNGQ